MVYSKGWLGSKLREMYQNAPHNEQVLMIHLFGIKYADIIRQYGYNAREIVEASGINESYVTELSKGMRMSKYVEIKPEKDTF